MAVVLDIFYEIIESWNHQSWQKPPKLLSAAVHITPDFPVDHVS